MKNSETIILIIGRIVFILFFIFLLWATRNKLYFFVYWQICIIIFSMVLSLEIGEIFKNLSESQYYEKSIQKMDEIKKEIWKIRTEPVRKRLEEIADGIREQFENY